MTAEGDTSVLNVHSEQGLKNSKSAALICEDDGGRIVGGAWGFGNASGRIDCGVVRQYGFGRTVEKQTGGGFVRCAGKLCGELL